MLAAVVADHPLAQLNNPVGGILRGGSAIVDLYATKIFRGRIHDAGLLAAHQAAVLG